MVNTVVVGAGRMGKRHIEAVSNLKQLKLTGVCDIKPEALKTINKELNIKANLLFTNVDELIHQAKPQLAIIATTAPSHYQLVSKFANKQCGFILCEKPMAPSIEECEKIIAECENNGTKLAINHQGRFLPRIKIPKDIIDSGEFGEFTSMTQIGGNIGIAMNAIHTIEAFLYLANEPITSVIARFSDEIIANPRGVEYQDRAGNILAISRNGKRLLIEIGADQGHGLLNIYMGRNGYLMVDEFNGEYRISTRNKEYWAEPTSRYACPSQTRTFAMEKADLITATQAIILELLKNGSYPDGHAGLNAVAATIAAYISDENNHKEINIQDVFNYRTRKFPWA